MSPADENSKAVDLVAVLLIAFAVLTFIFLVHVVLLPFAISAAIALVLSPAIDWLANKSRAPRLIVALLAFLVLAGLTGFAAYVAIPPLTAAALTMLTHFQDVIQGRLLSVMGSGKIEILGQSTSAVEIASAAVARLRTFAQTSNSVFVLAAAAFGGVFGIFLTLTLLAYFLASGAQLVKGLIWLFPPDWRPRAGAVIARLGPILTRYFAGVAVVVIYAGLAAYVGLAIGLRLRHAAFLAALTGVLEILPIVGPALSAVVAGIAAIGQAKSLWSVGAYVIYASALRLSIDQVVGPLVLGRAGRIHPTLVIFCFLAGGALFGVIGVILAVPAALAIKVTLETLYGEAVGNGQGAQVMQGLEKAGPRDLV
jgi:predicted PurR-regulated permease PerM